MGTNLNFIPWQKPEEWQEVEQFIRTIDQAHKTDFGMLCSIAKSIRRLFERLSDPMDALCSATCVNCGDICCKKATIWYDFKDLLYLYFAFDGLPEAQITKNKGCCDNYCTHFTGTGCTLSRLKRPFVCTWYLCPAQKQAMAFMGEQHDLMIQEKIDNIKILRSQIEWEFCRISSGNKC